MVFGLLILIHEFGHYIAARRCGVGVKEFFIGMGPRVFSWKSKKSGTEYGLRAFPIGGFVSMVGEEDDSDAYNAFCNKSVWKRMAIIIAGPLMNLLLGFLLMIFLVVGQKTLMGTTIEKFGDGALSSQKLLVNDEIVKVENTSVHTFNDLIYEIMHKGNEPVDITVIRDGKRVVVEDVSFPVVALEQGIEFGRYDFLTYSEEQTPINYLRFSFYRSISTVKMVFDSIGDLISGRYGIEAVSGPVGVTGVIADAAKEDFYSLLFVVIVISINLGVFNLIPFPALDGGRFFLYLIELIRGKPMKKEIEGYINFTGLMILLGFMVFVVIKDVFQLFGGL